MQLKMQLGDEFFMQQQVNTQTNYRSKLAQFDMSVNQQKTCMLPLGKHCKSMNEHMINSPMTTNETQKIWMPDPTRAESSLGRCGGRNTSP